MTPAMRPDPWLQPGSSRLAPHTIDAALPSPDVVSSCPPRTSEPALTHRACQTSTLLSKRAQVEFRLGKLPDPRL